ncbi:hypothetical protein R1sor_011714 [Riccia sorocarpa]|uniref:Uncharacterized protein n=1 Tax=Riccia sorocarpa TaxID=122646 RepID=A0ABD3I1R7_9MARC
MERVEQEHSEFVRAVAELEYEFNNFTQRRATLSSPQLTNDFMVFETPSDRLLLGTVKMHDSDKPSTSRAQEEEIDSDTDPDSDTEVSPESRAIHSGESLGQWFFLELFVARAVVLLEARIWAARIANLRPDSSVHIVRKGFLIFAMAESAMASAESKEVITLKEAKIWLQSKSAGGSRVVRVRLSRIGLRGKATYVGCPICTKSIYARDRCVHDISSPKSFYRLKAIQEDDTGELEAQLA